MCSVFPVRNGRPVVNGGESFLFGMWNAEGSHLEPTREVEDCCMQLLKVLQLFGCANEDVIIDEFVDLLCKNVASDWSQSCLIIVTYINEHICSIASL